MDKKPTHTTPAPAGGYGMFSAPPGGYHRGLFDPFLFDDRGALGKLFGIDGPRYQTWPERSARATLGAMALPGDVLTGKVDPKSEDGIGRAADLAMALIGSPLGGAPRGAIGSGAVRPYFRETSPDRARQFVPGGAYSGRNPFGRDEFWFSDDPALALGQQGNQGVLMQINPSMFTTKTNTSKPGAQFSSAKEYLGAANRDIRLEDALQGMLLNKKRISGRDPDAAFLSRHAPRMGWEMIETPAGLLVRKPGEDIQFLKSFAEGRGA